MNFHPQLLAIPIFAVAMAIEAFLILKSGQKDYDTKDAGNNILIGILSVVFGSALAFITTPIYFFAYENAPVQLSMSVWWVWLLLIIFDDFAYYWFHRISHESRLFWNFHVVHHSSNEYNFSVAVRQSWFGGIAHWIFYVPLAFLGFPFWAFALVHGSNLLYQFWIHTELVKRLPYPIEFVFNTPSHHRVHHGVNSEYLDKNYGGILIIWDRIFGTFEPEKAKVKYGITTPLNSYNPLWANTHAWFEMYGSIRGKNTFLGKLRCIFASPDMDFAEEPNLRNKPN